MTPRSVAAVGPRRPHPAGQARRFLSNGGSRWTATHRGSIVVDRFSDEIITNPKLNENPALKAWNEMEAASRLPGLKFGRTLWIAAAAGGPFEYTGLPLEEAHQEFNLTAAEFEEVGAEIVRALEHFQMPEREIEELVAAYLQSMPDVVSSST